jgi:hypothetical protein
MNKSKSLRYSQQFCPAFTSGKIFQLVPKIFQTEFDKCFKLPIPSSPKSCGSVDKSKYGQRPTSPAHHYWKAADLAIYEYFFFLFLAFREGVSMLLTDTHLVS